MTRFKNPINCNFFIKKNCLDTVTRQHLACLTCFCNFPHSFIQKGEITISLRRNFLAWVEVGVKIVYYGIREESKRFFSRAAYNTFLPILVEKTAFVYVQ